MATRARRVLGRFRRFVACNLGLSWNLKCVCRQVTATGRSGRIKSLGGKGPRPSGGEIISPILSSGKIPHGR